MLQQTQVDRVVPFYERFVEAYPTPAACAAGGSAEVVRRWSGLGYNRRALNLHRAATSIVDHHDGQVPSADAKLRALPGVGAYTARAVRSFGFGQDIAAVDTNGVRVLAPRRRGLPALGHGCFHPRRPPRAPRRFMGVQPDDVRPGRDGVHAPAPIAGVARSGASALGVEGVEETRGGLVRRCVRRARSRVPIGKGRGRLLEALRVGDVSSSEVAAACGWPDDVVRAERVAASLVEEGFARWRGTANPLLRLR